VAGSRRERVVDVLHARIVRAAGVAAAAAGFERYRLPGGGVPASLPRRQMRASSALAALCIVIHGQAADWHVAG